MRHVMVATRNAGLGVRRACEGQQESSGIIYTRFQTCYRHGGDDSERSLFGEWVELIWVLNFF